MNRREILVFEVAGREFGIPLGIVEEVVPVSPITPVPDSPPFLLGLTAVRGRVMGVIDAARRYKIGPALGTHFLVCKVRGNITAVLIDRPVIAGDVALRPLSPEEAEKLQQSAGVDKKFLRSGFEVMEPTEEGALEMSTGHLFFEVDADLFVSAEMASKTGEA